MKPLAVEDLRRCFEGVVPSVITTVSGDGTPNVTYLSQVHFMDSKHVALSCQFFNKTAQNVRENPYASVELLDPLTFDLYRLHLKYLRSEHEGPLFRFMSERVDAIASHTGMTGIFRLISADVYEVESIEAGHLFSAPLDPERYDESGQLTELRRFQIVSNRINRARDLDGLLNTTLATLDELFGFSHSMVLVPDDDDHLVTIATHGYPPPGVGARVPMGAGLIGTVARERCVLRMAVGADLRYGRAIRNTVERSDLSGSLQPEIPLPGLPDAQSELVLPLLVEDQLIAVLAIQSESPQPFLEWHEAYLGIIGNQIALTLDRMLRDDSEDPQGKPTKKSNGAKGGRRRTFTFYKNDDCVFVDGEYLIRNVPGRILWRVLTAYDREKRTDFTNRELRLDPTLGLPPLKDNLESRLILLRKRLEERCGDVRIASTGRGRFALVTDSIVELIERDSTSV